MKRTTPVESAHATRLWVSVHAAAVICIIGMAGAGCGARSSASDRVSLGLTAQRRGHDYQVRWNANSPLVREGVTAVLAIRDGGAARQIELDRTQLQSASVVYSPISETVTFQLTVYPQPAVEAVSMRNGSPVPLAVAPPVYEPAIGIPATSSEAAVVPEASVPQRAKDPDESGFAVQVGVFRTRSEAERYEAVIRRAHVAPELRPAGESLRLWAGCFSTASEAAALADRLQTPFPRSVVVRGCDIGRD